jgi:PH (Pleckstrin Homology) domain-containing protein
MNQETLLMAGERMQAVTGVTPPQQKEAIIREAFPSVVASPLPGAKAGARLGRMLNRSIIGAPLAWALLIPPYFAKVMPFLAKRYTITNRRVMIRRGLLPKATHEVALSDIEDIHIHKNADSDFYREGTLEIISNGKPALTLEGVPEPESFREAILNASRAWAPGKMKTPFIPAKKAE